MLDRAARIKDLTERIESIEKELAEHDAGKTLGGGAPKPADLFFDDTEGRERRLRELKRELAGLEGHDATSQVTPGASLDMPTYTVPDATGQPLPDPFDEPDVTPPQASSTPAEPKPEVRTEPRSDPMNDPEIKEIERRYHETIAKLDEASEAKEQIDAATEAFINDLGQRVSDIMPVTRYSEVVDELDAQPPIDPHNDPEIKEIERRYRETIAKLDEASKAKEQIDAATEAFINDLGQRVSDIMPVIRYSEVVDELDAQPPIDPMNDPEIKEIERRYHQTISELDRPSSVAVQPQTALNPLVIGGILVALVAVALLVLRPGAATQAPTPTAAPAAVATPISVAGGGAGSPAPARLTGTVTTDIGGPESARELCFALAADPALAGAPWVATVTGDWNLTEPARKEGRMTADAKMATGWRFTGGGRGDIGIVVTHADGRTLQTSRQYSVGSGGAPDRPPCPRT